MSNSTTRSWKPRGQNASLGIVNPERTSAMKFTRMLMLISIKIRIRVERNKYKDNEKKTAGRRPRIHWQWWRPPTSFHSSRSHHSQDKQEKSEDKKLNAITSRSVLDYQEYREKRERSKKEKFIGLRCRVTLPILASITRTITNPCLARVCQISIKYYRCKKERACITITIIDSTWKSVNRCRKDIPPVNFRNPASQFQPEYREEILISKEIRIHNDFFVVKCGE